MTYLVKMQQDYGDEFDVKGFSVMSQADWDDMLRLAKESFEAGKTLVISFGSNEELIFDSLREFERAFTVVEITDAEHMMLKRLFDDTCYRRHVSFGTLTPVDVWERVGQK